MPVKSRDMTEAELGLVFRGVAIGWTACCPHDAGSLREVWMADGILRGVGRLFAFGTGAGVVEGEVTRAVAVAADATTEVLTLGRVFLTTGVDSPRSFPRLATPTPQVSCVL